MKYLTAIIVSLSFISSNVKGQDRMILKNGSEIESKVIEIHENEIKYKKYENVNGPSYTIKKEEVILVLYENGTKDIFDREEPGPEVVQKEPESTSAFDVIRDELPVVEKISTSGIGYIPVYNNGGYGGVDDAFSFGLTMEDYSARRGKIGFGYNLLLAGSFYDDGFVSSQAYTTALGLGPGVYAYANEHFRLWVGAYGGAYYTFGSASVYGYSGYGIDDETDFSEFDFYYNISAIATYLFSETIGVYAKLGYSNIDILSFGLAWSPKRNK